MLSTLPSETYYNLPSNFKILTDDKNQKFDECNLQHERTQRLYEKEWKKKGNEYFEYVDKTTRCNTSYE